jgi:hypothetical protein
MTLLFFNAKSLPRTISKNEWRKIDRWRRQTQKILAAETRRQIENLGTFGATHPEYARDMMDKIINPPLLVDPTCGGVLS